MGFWDPEALLYRSHIKLIPRAICSFSSSELFRTDYAMKTQKLLEHLLGITLTLLFSFSLKIY